MFTWRLKVADTSAQVSRELCDGPVPLDAGDRDLHLRGALPLVRRLLFEDVFFFWGGRKTKKYDKLVGFVHHS